LKTGLQEIGDRLTKEWLMRGGADGLAIIDAYRRLRQHRRRGQCSHDAPLPRYRT
jgi:hypothetical protein